MLLMCPVPDILWWGWHCYMGAVIRHLIVVMTPPHIIMVMPLIQRSKAEFQDKTVAEADKDWNLSMTLAVMQEERLGVLIV